MAVKPRIAVLMGGRSSEREISLVTGAQVTAALEALEYPVDQIDAGASIWEELTRLAPQAVFIALHGRFGEDGTVQALLEMKGIPYTGSSVLASALAMDKAMTKVVLGEKGLPLAASIDVAARDWHADPEAIRLQISTKVGFPCVTKPAREGSAMGVTIVEEQAQLTTALAEVFNYDDIGLVEEFLPGTEFTVGVLGNEELRALPSVEVVPSGAFYDFASKYAPGGSNHIIPARLPDGMEEIAADLAIRAHKAIGCRDFSRTDFKLNREGKPCILEINTIPGMTPTSLFPEAAKAAGIPFDQLIETLIGYAIARA